jgi:hypothetical protein
MNREDLIKRINSDTRTKDQCFDDLCERMRVLAVEAGSPEPSREEQEKAARNLIGFFNTLLEGRMERAQKSEVDEPVA